MAPKSGSRPISWYQNHQDRVYDHICYHIRDNKWSYADVTVKNGMVLIKNNGKSYQIGSAYQIYNFADYAIRKN
jgi:hypothetical protein